MQSAESTDPNSSVPEKQIDVISNSQISEESVDANVTALTQLNTLMEESLQIYELEDQKTNVINDLHNALQVITQFLGFSSQINPEIFNLPADSRVLMLPNLKLIIMLSNDKTETKKFTDYSPEIITKIVEYTTPQLLDLIKVQKSYLTEKITFLRTATKQLSTLNQLKENLPSVIPNEE